MKKTILSLASLAFVCAMTLTSCEQIMSTIDNPVSSYLAIETADMELVVGQDSLRPATTISPETVKYTSSDEKVAIVDASGKVSARGAGTATITASVPANEYYQAGKQEYKVNVSKVAVTFDESNQELWTDNPLYTRTVTAKNSNKAVITYISENPKVATVNAETGEVKALSGGETKIKVRVSVGDYYVDEPASYKLTVYKYVYLPNFTEDYTAQDYDMIGGNGDEWNHGIQIADGATVFLDWGVNIYNPEGAAISCVGDATVVLRASWVDATIQSSTLKAGLAVGPAGKTLTIKGEGNLTAIGASQAAGIGSNNQGTCGNIIIEGGNITATTSSFAAGIGCGLNGVCGDITIKGGTIVAQGKSSSYGAAGIGSACAYFNSQRSICGKITISGGDVTAYGAFAGAGIGSGMAYNLESVCGDITITGGTVKATGGQYATGIGTGAQNWASIGSYCANITITGGNITATKGSNAAVYDVGCSNYGTIFDGCTVTVDENVKIKTNSGADANIWKPAAASAPRRAAAMTMPAMGSAPVKADIK